MRPIARLPKVVVVGLLALLLVSCSSGGSQSKSQSIPSAASASLTQTSSSTTVTQTSTPLPISPTSSPASTPVITSQAPRVHSSPTPHAVSSGTTEPGNWAVFGGPMHGLASISAKLTPPHTAWNSPQLDGEVYAQPLIVNSQVYVATENNTIYALNAWNGAVAWRTHFGDPVPRSSLPCGDIDPTGITGTPVIDMSTGLLYTVAFLNPGHHELIAVDIHSGAIKFKRPIDPPGSNPITQQQRSALVYANGYVYVAYGGLDGDCGQYHGWVVGSPLNGKGALISYKVPTSNLGAIWAPPGPTLAPDGSLYASTGNGASQSTFDFGDAVIRLTPQLKVRDWFAPSNWKELNADDLDLASSSPALLSGGLIFQIGKAGVGYLLKADHLGHIGGQVFQAQVCSGGYGGTAYQAPWLYVSCSNGLTALKIGPGNTFRVEWRQVGGMVGTPVIAGGAVWTLGINSATLYAIDPISGKVLYQKSVGEVMHFASPSASGGTIYAPAGRHVVAVVTF